MNNVILHPNSMNLAKEVKRLSEEYSISLIEAALMLSDNTGIEEEIIGNAIREDDITREEIRIEAEKLHFIEKTNRIDFS